MEAVLEVACARLENELNRRQEDLRVEEVRTRELKKDISNITVAIEKRPIEALHAVEQVSSALHAALTQISAFVQEALVKAQASAREREVLLEALATAKALELTRGVQQADDVHDLIQDLPHLSKLWAVSRGVELLEDQVSAREVCSKLTDALESTGRALSRHITHMLISRELHVSACERDAVGRDLMLELHKRQNTDAQRSRKLLLQEAVDHAETWPFRREDVPAMVDDYGALS
ncbi:hypothetical protein PYCC9005_001450 [Savitreella phatthalungensis]